MGVIEEKLGTSGDRVVFEYDIPDEYANGVKTVGLIKLTADEEIMAARRAGTDRGKLAQELSKACVREINGQVVSHADGSLDKLWNTMDPAVRNLIVGEYAELHAPSEAAEQVFRKSRRVRA